MKEQFSIIPEWEKRIITASVGFVSPSSNSELFLAVRNKRGWDIPGGHVMEGEEPLQTFERELQEETGCRLISSEAQKIAILESKTDRLTGIAIYRGVCSVETFTPTDEILERKFFPEKELLENYFGDKDLLLDLLNLCRQKSS